MDAEARGVKKSGKSVLGYKQHTVVDDNGLVIAVETTAANCHDSKPLLTLLDKAGIKPGTPRLCRQSLLQPDAMVRIQGTALLRINQSTRLAYFTSHGLQPEKIAKIVCRQADAGAIMGMIRPSNPIMISLRRLFLECLRETHKKYFINHEKI